MLKAELIGNLGHNPEMSYTPNGIAVTKFSIACSKVRKNADGEKTETTQWVNVTCWRKMAENANDYLRKGNKVYVCGELNVRQYTTKDNRQGVSIDVEASEIEYLTPRSSQQEAGNFDDTLAEIAKSDYPY
jgi:single-strand DNA-binding protein